MAEKRKTKKRKEDIINEKPEKPAKEEYALAKWLRKNVQIKKTKFLNHNVEYFTAVKALDALMASHWGTAKEGQEAFFPTRAAAIEMLDNMLRHKFFHRARKIPVSEEELKARQKKKIKKSGGDEKEKDEAGESSHAEGDKKEEEEKKKKRKIRLEMHNEQLFVDGLDAYVWIYDPIPVYYWFFGALLVLGAIAICLFPLWPPTVRKGVYYLSIAAAGFLVFIIALILFRMVVFCILWVVTIGKHHLWLFPNLTEDVGFLASFWPLYHYEYKGGLNESDKKGTKKKKEKDSDNEDDNNENDEEKDERDDQRNLESFSTDESTGGKGDGDEEERREGEGEGEGEPSESESESSSQKSQTGKDFEMVEREEIES